MPATNASQRRQTRLRREYLYRKSLEGREKVLYEQKRQVREALAAGKPLPTELRATYDELQKEVDAEDARTGGHVRTHIDDEYAGVSGLNKYADGMIRLDDIVGDFHDKLTIVQVELHSS